MEKFKKYGIAALVILLLLAVNLVISIILHGYVMAAVEDPFSIAGLTEVFEDQKDSEILDTCEEGDSALVLVKKADGNVFLLEFHKNLLLPRYQLLDVVHVVPEATEEHLPVSTVFRSYSVLVENHQSLTQETTHSHKLNLGTFFLLYGMNAILLALMEFAVYKTGKKYKKKKSKK